MHYTMRSLARGEDSVSDTTGSDEVSVTIPAHAKLSSHMFDGSLLHRVSLVLLLLVSLMPGATTVRSNM